MVGKLSPLPEVVQAELDWGFAGNFLLHNNLYFLYTPNYLTLYDDRLCAFNFYINTL